MVTNLDKLIIEKDSLKELTKNPAWSLLMKKLSELRVDAMDQAVAVGDTTDSKAYARALGAIIVILYSFDNDIELDDLMARKELLKKEIEDVETDRRNQQNGTYNGLGATL